MDIKQIYKITGHTILGEDITDEEHEAFFVELENMMNKHKIFYLEAYMNPYKKLIKMEYN